MDKYVKKNFVYWIVMTCCLFVISCGNQPGSNDTGNAASTNNTPSTATPAAKAAVNSGPLDILYVSRAVFDSFGIGTRLVFAHSVGNNNKIQLSGWEQQGNQFPAVSKFDLINGVQSNLQYGPGIYISNVVLPPAKFNLVKGALLPGASYVIFRPKMVDTNFIGYDIEVSPGIPTLTSQPATVITDANPSPPRDSQ